MLTSFRDWFKNDEILTDDEVIDTFVQPAPQGQGEEVACLLLTPSRLTWFVM